MQKFEAEVMEEVERQNALARGGNIAQFPSKTPEKQSGSGLDRVLDKAAGEAVQILRTAKVARMRGEISPENMENILHDVALRRLESYVGIARNRIRHYEEMLAKREAHMKERIDKMRQRYGNDPRIADMKADFSEVHKKAFGELKENLLSSIQGLVLNLGVSEATSVEIVEELVHQEEKVLQFPKK